MLRASALVLATLGFGSISSAQESLVCEQGPVSREYGGSEWWVYGCNDLTSLVFVSGPDSPAGQFYFIMFVENDQIRLHGEGTGEKSFTQAAFDEISKIDDAQRQALLDETMKLPPAGN